MAISASAASALVVEGSFLVNIYQSTNTGNPTGADSLVSNIGPGNFKDSIIYTGKLDFATSDGTDSTTIVDWLGTGVDGSVLDLDAGVGGLQMSKPSISDGTATTTWFEFLAVAAPLEPLNLTFTHDDGFVFQDDGVTTASYVDPTSSRTTSVVNGQDGGIFRLVYAATNGDPSIVKVEAFANFVPTFDEPPAVPLPAGVWLMGTVLAGFGVASRRRRKAS